MPQTCPGAPRRPFTAPRTPRPAREPRVGPSGPPGPPGPPGPSEPSRRSARAEGLQAARPPLRPAPPRPPDPRPGRQRLSPGSGLRLRGSAAGRGRGHAAPARLPARGPSGKAVAAAPSAREAARPAGGTAGLGLTEGASGRALGGGASPPGAPRSIHRAPARAASGSGARRRLRRGAGRMRRRRPLAPAVSATAIGSPRPGTGLRTSWRRGGSARRGRGGGEIDSCCDRPGRDQEDVPGRIGQDGVTDGLSKSSWPEAPRLTVSRNKSQRLLRAQEQREEFKGQTPSAPVPFPQPRLKGQPFHTS
nr:translation initiation factor IF-2-like [Equus asinus]